MEFVRLTDVTKEFSGVKALSGVSLSAYAGEVLALVGENGAGKSTLMNILSGTYPAGSYSGEIKLRGNSVRFTSPADAEKHGVAIIHQELSTFPHLTVAENLFVGHWPRQSGFVDFDFMVEEAKKCLAEIHADIDPRQLMSELSTGQQQLVEIAKAISRNSELLILDEPTSSLTPSEVENLFVLLRRLRSKGKALIYISHKMEEIFSLSDRISIIRDGKSILSDFTKNLDEQKVITSMVGRSLDRLFPNPPGRNPAYLTEAPVLRLKNVQISSPSLHRSVGPINFDLRRGEILGFAGLLGAGRTELMQALVAGPAGGFNIEGEVEFQNQKFASISARSSLGTGIGLVSEDRKRDSIFPSRSLEENVSLSRLILSFLGSLLAFKQEKETNQKMLQRLKTKFNSSEQAISELSGGNQQKVVLGRVLQINPSVLILDEPTRGVDVGAKYEIYQIIFELAQSGKSILLVSSDLPELMALSDRILVLSEGQQVTDLKRSEFSQEKIMAAAVKNAKVSS